MTINYTSLLGLAQPLTGTEANTWGTVVNDEITALVEEAIAGGESISVTAGDVTMTDTDGVSNQARNAILIITGTPGTTRNVIAPSTSKTYIVINNSDSSVVIKGNGSPPTTGVTITATDKALVAWNGSDFVRVGASAGGSNTQVQYNSNGNLAGSANLTFDGTKVTAAGIKDSALTSGRVTYATTSGELTDSSNLTFDGTKLTAAGIKDSALTSGRVTYATTSGELTDSANLTFSGTILTANGFSGPINGSIGASTPSTGVFTDVTLNAQGDVRFADSDSSNWVAFQGAATIASNVTWTLPSADGTNGQFLSTNGLGTLSWATASGGGGGGGTSVTVTQITATGGQTSFTVSYTVGQVSVYLNGALLAAADYTATSGTAIVLATGAAANDIFTAVVYSSVTQIIQGDTSVTVSDSGSNGTITFTTDNSERMRIDSSGNLGLGTTTPNTAGYGGAVLGIYGGSNTGGNIWLTSDTTAAGNRAGRIGFGTEGNSTNKEIARVWSLAAGSTAGNLGGDLLFSTKPDGGALTERARITSGGNLDLQKNLGLGGASATTSGTGITFPATQSASSDANTLDDYEEGTFTPVVTYSGTNTPTYGTQSGRYTKVGRSVQIQIYLQWNESSSTGNITITSLPFTSAALPYGVVSTISAGLSSWPTNASVGGFVAPSDTKINMYVNDGVPTVFSATYTGASQELYLNVNYFV